MRAQISHRPRVTVTRLTRFTALAVVLLSATFIPSIGAQASKEPAIGGYCPVAYVMAGKASKGDPKFTSTVDGQTYQLTNAMVKDMFDKEPARDDPRRSGDRPAWSIAGCHAMAGWVLPFAIAPGGTLRCAVRRT